MRTQGSGKVTRCAVIVRLEIGLIAVARGQTCANNRRRRLPSPLIAEVLTIKLADEQQERRIKMLKNKPEFLLQILNDYSSGITNSLEVLAQINGVSIRSLFVWMRDPTITVDFMGREGITFGQAMTMARNVMKVVTVGKTLEEYVLRGREIQVWHGGAPSYLDDEEAILEEDLDVREMLYGYRDGKKRDANGNRIIATRIEYAPAQLIEKYAASNMSAVYGNKSEVTMRGNVGLGVTVVGQRPPLPPEVQAMVAGEITDMVKVKVPQIAPATDTPEQYEPEPNLDVPVTAPEPERVIRSLPGEREKIAPPTPKPVGINEIPERQPRSELERSLFDALRKARERAQQP